jgi:hypothetical protein
MVTSVGDQVEGLTLSIRSALVGLTVMCGERGADDAAAGLLDAAVQVNDELLASLGVPTEQVRMAEQLERWDGDWPGGAT